jgi:hypothetical protein
MVIDSSLTPPTSKSPKIQAFLSVGAIDTNIEKIQLQTLFLFLENIQKFQHVQKVKKIS